MRQAEAANATVHPPENSIGCCQKQQPTTTESRDHDVRMTVCRRHDVWCAELETCSSMKW
jgi:hypothetical protein